jgi:hypothetical protein
MMKELIPEEEREKRGGEDDDLADSDETIFEDSGSGNCDGDGAPDK